MAYLLRHLHIMFDLSGRGGVSVRCAIWLPVGKIVFVRIYDACNNVAIIEHDDGKIDRVAATKIHLLGSPEDLMAATKSGGRDDID